jgi:hypothetical protein
LLNNNNITLINPQALYELISLQKLDLSHNSLSVLTLEKTFGSQNSLRDFNLSHNKLTAISGAFAHLLSLQKLNLSNNMLDLEINSSTIFTGLSKLTDLDLSNNRIVIIRYNLLHPLSNIVLLDLSNNQIQRFDIGSLVNIDNNAKIILEGNDIIKISDINSLTKDKLYDFLLSHQNQSINSGIVEKQPRQLSPVRSNTSIKSNTTNTSNTSNISSLTSNSGSYDQQTQPVPPSGSQSSNYRSRPKFGNRMETPNGTSFGGGDIYYDRYIKYKQKNSKLVGLIKYYSEKN